MSTGKVAWTGAPAEAERDSHAFESASSLVSGSAQRRVPNGSASAALALVESSSPRLSTPFALADVLVEAIVACEPVPRETVGDVVERLAQTTGTSTVEAAFAIYVAGMCSPALTELQPRRAVEANLSLLYLLAPLTQASLWRASAAASLEPFAHVGPNPSRHAEQRARAVLDGRVRESRDRSSLYALPIGSERPEAALVIRPYRAAATTAKVFAGAAARGLAPLVSYERRLRSRVERDLAGEAEGRIRRLALDLHDGPLQHLAMLRGEIALLRTQARSCTDRSQVARLLSGRLDDLDARAAMADEVLREACRSVASPDLRVKSLLATIADLTSSFAAETGIDVGVDAVGDLDDLSSSAQTAIVRIVQEALSNVRKHSCAGRVVVRVRGRADSIVLEVRDDGRGFDVDVKLEEAGARGRLGLVGMSERARLQGGRLEIVSSTSGSTAIVATIPRRRQHRVGGAGSSA